MKDIIEKLRVYRLINRISQAQMAACFNISQSYYSRIETDDVGTVSDELKSKIITFVKDNQL